MRYARLLATASVVFCVGCMGADDEELDELEEAARWRRVSISVSPEQVTVAPSATTTFRATVSGSSDQVVTWRVSAGGGSITDGGLYVAPGSVGTYQVIAVPRADPRKQDVATVNVVAAADAGTVDAATPDAAVDAAMPDAAVDAGLRDAAVDAAAIDAAVRDAAVDATTPDAAVDAGARDAQVVDATVQDAGSLDSGATGSTVVTRSHVGFSEYSMLWPTNSPGAFRDVAGNHNLLVPAHVLQSDGARRLVLKVSTDDGQSWRTLAPSTTYLNSNSFFFQSAVQSSNGDIHLLGTSWNGYTYWRLSLVRSAGAVTDFTRVAQFDLRTPTGQTDNKSQLRVIRDKAGVECLAAVLWSSESAGSALYLTKTLDTSPTSAASFTGVDGLGSQTLVERLTHGNHEYAPHLGQVENSKDLFVVHGQIPAEGFFGPSTVRSIRVAAKDLHSWSPPELAKNHTSTQWHVTGVSSTANYVWIAAANQTEGLCIDRISADGTYQHNVVPPLLTRVPFSGVQVAFHVASDERRIFAAWHTLDFSGDNGHAVYLNGAWRKTAASATVTSAHDSWGFSSSDNWDDGLISVMSDEPDRNIRISSVFTR